MQHLTFGDKTVFIGDEAADTLLSYTALLAERGASDKVALNAIGPDGHAVRATFVLDGGSSVMTESADNVFIEPNNTEAVRYMVERSQAISNPPQAQPLSSSELEDQDSFGPGDLD